jgi:hypothetical protein
MSAERTEELYTPDLILNQNKKFGCLPKLRVHGSGKLSQYSGKFGGKIKKSSETSS